MEEKTRFPICVLDYNGGLVLFYSWFDLLDFAEKKRQEAGEFWRSGVDFIPKGPFVFHTKEEYQGCP